MDAIFGGSNYRNDITWHRARGKGLNPRRYVHNCDRLLYYTKGKEKPTWNQQYQAFEDGYGDDWKTDEHGPWEAENLTGGKAGGPEAYLPFRGVLPATGRAWAPPVRDKFPPILQHHLPSDYEDLNQLEKCEALDAVGLIYWPKKAGGKPRYKKYLSTLEGRYISDLFADISPVQAHAKERIGYPTQKPLALLDRIIRASSNPGDMVLDPFCGCATALVAAETLGRRWAGIDLSPLAVRLVGQRLRDQHGLFGQITARDDVPKRTDLGELPNYRTHRHTLYGRQEGICNGCLVLFPFRNLTVDHIVPQSKGGSDHPDNLQLLCGACNSKKGERTMEALIADLLAAQIRPETPHRRTRR